MAGTAVIVDIDVGRPLRSARIFSVIVIKGATTSSASDMDDEMIVR